MTSTLSPAKEIQNTARTYSVFRLLRETSDSIDKARRRWIRKYMISPIRLDVLHTITSIGDRATPAEISRRVFREPHSVSGLLKRMENEGLIWRVKDLEKKNMVRVALTDKGFEMYDQATKGDPVHRIISDLSDEAIENLMSALLTMQDQALEQSALSQTNRHLRP